MYKIGDRVKVSSENDNENYNSFRDTEDGDDVPCALYEYEYLIKIAGQYVILNEAEYMKYLIYGIVK